MVQNFTVKLNATHSHMPNRLNEVRFDLRSTIGEVKNQLERKFGTSSECMKLELRDSSDKAVCEMPDNAQTLGDFAPQENYTIHVVDDSGTAIKNEFEDVSKVEKYKISEKAYNERDDTYRKFAENNPHIMAAKKANQIPEDFCKEEADKMEKDQRIETTIGNNRGKIAYIGKVTKLGAGYWVGIILDEPYGNSNGVVNG